jgi:AP-2 complex subunit mu-1
MPFKVIPVVEEHGKTRVVLNVKIIANFSSELTGNNVVVKIPVPPTTATCNLLVSSGR